MLYSLVYSPLRTSSSLKRAVKISLITSI